MTCLIGVSHRNVDCSHRSGGEESFSLVPHCVVCFGDVEVTYGCVREEKELYQTLEIST